MLNVLKENIGSTLEDIGIEKDFLNKTPFTTFSTVYLFVVKLLCSTY